MPTKALPSVSLLALVYAALALAMPVSGSAQQHLRYKLIDLGTLGGPQSFGDGGHNAANINNQGIAAGVADTATLNPFPNFGLNGINGPDQNLDPFVHHAFLTKNGVLTDLGTLPGASNSSSPTWVTENGWVSGVSLTGSIDPITGWIVQHAVLWKDGKIIDLGTLLGGFESATSQVNSKGQVTGLSTNDVPDPLSLIYFLIGGGFTNGTQTRAFRWDSATGMHDLGTLGGPDAEGSAINEQGQIVGASDTNSTLNPVTQNFTVEPFFWENGTMTGLGTLGGTLGFPSGLNNRGEVNGTSNLAGDTCTHIFLWSAPGPMHDLGSPLGACVLGEVGGITDTGEFLSQALITGEQKFHAFIWKNGTYTDLGRLPDLDDTCVGAFGINSRGQVVGQVVENLCAGPRAHAFIWQDGRMTDLNVFVPASSDLTLEEVEQINDRGEMFGIATNLSGDFHAFLLIPCEQGHDGCVDSADAAVSNEARRPMMSASTTGRLLEVQRAKLRNFRNHWMARYHGLASVPAK